MTTEPEKKILGTDAVPLEEAPLVADALLAQAMPLSSEADRQNMITFGRIPDGSELQYFDLTAQRMRLMAQDLLAIYKIHHEGGGDV